MTQSLELVAIPMERIERRILTIRSHNVMLDSDLAELYEVDTYILNQAVKRNIERFPKDFMFQLSHEEWEVLRSQIVTSNNEEETLSSQIVSSNRIGKFSRCQSGIPNERRGGRRSLPYAFTEQGVAMLSGVLRSPRAVQVNIGIMRAFVKLRQLLTSHVELARKLADLEKKYDRQFQVVFDAIRQIMEAPKPKQNTQPRTRPIGFVPWEDKKKSENGFSANGKRKRGMATAKAKQ